MDFRDRSELIRRSDRALAGASVDPRKLVAVYIGITAGVMLLATLANFLLQSQIAGTGGLSGLAMRSMLETAIQVLQLVVNLVIPFWTFGYLTCVLRMVRGQSFRLDGLLDGFQHFGPVLRLNLLRGSYFMVLAILCIYPSMLIFQWTPLSHPFQAVIEPYMEQGVVTFPDDAALAAAMEAMMPLLLIYGIVFLILAGPKFYSFRMADYCLMDDPKAGARAALQRSSAMLHKKRLELLKLDLRFWWFYLLDGLTLVLCYGDSLLALAGITLPLNGSASYFLFYALYLVAQFGLYVWARNKVECTYAAGYECLKQELDEKIRQLMAQQPQNP